MKYCQVIKYIILYIIIILLFAFFYYLQGEIGIKTSDNSYLNMLYFSVVTITTLGYGDVIPINVFTKLLVSIESILGIFILGIILNAIWKIYTDYTENQYKKELKSENQRQNDEKLKSYTKYFKIKTEKLLNQILLTTTPAKDRGNKDGKDIEIFDFNDLVDIFLPSMVVTKSLFSTSIEDLLNIENEFINEIKYLIANYNFESFRELYTNLHQYLEEDELDEYKNAIFSYKKLITEGSGKTSFQEQIEKIIKKATPNPSTEDYPGNIVTPIIIFYYSLKRKIKIVLKIHENINNISK